MINLKPTAIVEAFPEGKDILKGLLRDVNREIKRIHKIAEKIFADETISKDVKAFIIRYIGILFVDDLIKKRDLLKRQLGFYDGDRKELDITAAKSIPIESLYDFKKMRQSRQRIAAACPFHDEKIPSFVIYKNTNSFHCFSCKESGDAISFIMKLYGYTFINSVKYLLSVKQ